MKKTLTILTIFHLFIITLAANNEDQPYLTVVKTKTPIQLDGVLDEAFWQRSQPAKDFWEYFPSDSSLSKVQTEVYMAFDDDFLYIGAKCYSVGENYLVPTLRRDYRAGGNDNITFLLDPFNDKTNAFVFGMNPYGVTREALISNGGRNGGDFDTSWDNKWSGASKIYDGYWICELAIPFNTLRFKEGEKEWNFNCYRFDTQSNTRSTWQKIPQNQVIMNLAFMGKMLWEESPRKTSSSISLIPYTSWGYNENIEESEDAGFLLNFGGDVKMTVTPSLNLDLTVNPDFSNVEVDRQVINLDRFEIFFPERRQFFLENGDLFGSFGNNRINPFFSRRIGSATVEYPVEDSETETETIQNSIRFGARLSGKLNNNWRLGFLNMQTSGEKEYGLPQYNFTVAALQRKVFSRSNIGMIFVNKQATSDSNSPEFYSNYNRVVGFDYNIASNDNAWTGKVFYHKGFTDNQEVRDEENFAHGASLSYWKRSFRVSWGHEWVGEDYDAEVGFVRRLGYFSIYPEARLYYYPKKGFINRHGPQIETNFLWKPDFGKTDHQIALFWTADLNNTAEMGIGVQNEYISLIDDFDPSRTDSDPLLAGTDYTYNSAFAFFSTDRRKKISIETEVFYGSFFNGIRFGASTQLNLLLQPFAVISLDANLSYLDLPTVETSLILLGPRFDITFSKSVFLTTFLQYNNQIDNININSRFQWRFAPVSDFFIVYSSNYGVDNFGPKQQAVTAKLTYWFNT